ncbi:MAG: hypothetical protein ACI9KE_005126 [Polyangiales bacterium]|jgi:hypothetical protein
MQSGGVGQMKKQIVGILLVALSGCHVAGTATMVRTTRAWGELTLSGTYLDRVADAVILMATHCDGPFSVVDHDSETGFTETPSPEQTRVQFVCPARVETRRYRQAQHRTAGGERSTPRSLVIPGSVTEAAPAIALTASVTTAASPTALTTASPTITSAEVSEPPATSPALALSPPMPSQMSMSSSAASPSATSPATPSPPD